MKPETDSLPMARRPLVPLGWLYGAVIRARNAHYDRIAAASHLAEIPVISVGNITVGGTGKTPIVIETVRRLNDLGASPAILTRGYGAAPGETPDEVIEFEQTLPGVPVVVNPDRVAGAQEAHLAHGADCAVLDDGFQHRRLRRDLDIIVIDALDPWGGGRMLPAGRLREPLAGLGRAHLFVISRSNQAEQQTVERIEDTLSELAPQASIVRATVEVDAIVHVDDQNDKPGMLGYHNVLPVCGIGNPITFLRSLGQHAGRVCKPLLFRDHHRYGEASVRRILSIARKRGADLVVTTRKDWVKLAPIWPDRASGAADAELVRLDVRVDLHDEDNVFEDCLRSTLEKRV